MVMPIVVRAGKVAWQVSEADTKAVYGFGGLLTAFALTTDPGL